MGLKGEAATDDSIWICKTHHPLVIAMQSMFTSNKTVMIVRNPLDVFPSYASFANTMSHGNKTEFEIHSEYPEWWAWLVKRQAQNMKEFFRIIRNECLEKGRNPLYIVRYEDLILEPKETLMGMFAFIFGEKDLIGTNAERRIDQVVALGK